MNVLAITTRDYYKIVANAYWEKLECSQISNFISSLYNDNSKTADAKTRIFYLKEHDSIPFWNTYKERFYALARQHDNDYIVYVIPCIPRSHNNDGELCGQLLTRQNYVGTFLEFVLDDIKGKNLDVDTLLLVCHDADILPKDNETNSEPERAMQVGDLIEGSLLTKHVYQNSINIENIYGFRHENHEGGIYRLFNGELDKETLPPDLFNQIIEAIGKARKTYELVSSLETSHPESSQHQLDGTDTNQSVCTRKAYSEKPVQLSICLNNGVLTLCGDNPRNSYGQLITQLNELFRNSTFKLPDGKYHANIVIHQQDILANLSQNEQQYTFGQESFTNTRHPLPIIHFCNCSLKKTTEYYRYASIMDSSIWNYFVELETDPSFNSILIKEATHSKKAIEAIVKNTNRKLYELSVAKEHAEFHARLTRDAYFYNFGGAHANRVSPFVFHSEYGVKKLIKRELIGTKIIEKISKHKWRILLIDDKSETKLSPFTNNQTDCNEHLDNKLKIIKHRLTDLFYEEANIKDFAIDSDQPQENGILIEYAETYNKACEILKSKKYDIVLLDYLLDKEGNKQHYGNEILNSIRSEEKGHYKTGPCKRFFFMFISAYSSAVHDRLLADGLSLSENYWHISLGACPTNTPQLFLYYLLKLMDKRLENSGIYDLETENIIEQLDFIYKDSEKDVVRRRANAKYQDILKLQSYFKNLLDDVSNPSQSSIFCTDGSVLVTNFVLRHSNLGGLLEHIVHLVHITAFGTIRQWPEMWEEYIFIKTILYAEMDNSSCKDKIKSIENYILELKKQTT